MLIAMILTNLMKVRLRGGDRKYKPKKSKMLNKTWKSFCNLSMLVNNNKKIYIRTLLNRSS